MIAKLNINIRDAWISTKLVPLPQTQAAEPEPLPPKEEQVLPEGAQPQSQQGKEAQET